MRRPIVRSSQRPPVRQVDEDQVSSPRVDIVPSPGHDRAEEVTVQGVVAVRTWSSDDITNATSQSSQLHPSDDLVITAESTLPEQPGPLRLSFGLLSASFNDQRSQTLVDHRLVAFEVLTKTRIQISAQKAGARLSLQVAHIVVREEQPKNNLGLQVGSVFP